MANEIQRYYRSDEPAPFKDFFDNVRNPLSTFYENHNRLERMSIVLNNLAASDFETTAHPAGLESATLTALGNLRTQIDTYLAAQSTLDMVAQCKAFFRI